MFSGSNNIHGNLVGFVLIFCFAIVFVFFGFSSVHVHILMVILRSTPEKPEAEWMCLPEVEKTFSRQEFEKLAKETAEDCVFIFYGKVIQVNF